MSTLSLSGLMLPVTSPFGTDGELDRSMFDANARSWLAFAAGPERVRGFVVAGSSGEAALLDDTERGTLLEWAREVLGASRTLIAGVGSESARQTIARARVAKAAGADAVLVVAPHYYLKRTTPAALEAHYRAIADASPLPVLLYNIPVYAHLVLEPALVHTLSTHPNVVGMKDSAGNLEMLREYLAAQGDTFRVLTGSGGTLQRALTMGVSGAILAIGLYATAQVLALVAAQQEGHTADAETIQASLVPLATDIAAALGPAGIKAAMDAVGLMGGTPRLPLLPVSDEERARVLDRLTVAGVMPAAV
ncbi:MAG: dihydrodipicolinate synthase family protein [Gemmatimonadaceae bacterium]|jgi:4-hydroxy-2-oxoglutarate aldolase|nr:dihydrodipicolinate synthase family protein [Gemmatimonadaceae bacterium]